MRGTPPILVVDDDYSIRESLQDFLESEGQAVITAKNGIEALEILKEIKPQFIILDMMMPGMTGREFRLLQLADEKLREIPVFLCSASILHEETSDLQLAGEIAKPFDLDVLTRKLNCFLKPTPTESLFRAGVN